MTSSCRSPHGITACTVTLTEERSPPNLAVIVSQPSPMSHSLSTEPRHVNPQTITSVPYVRHQRVKFPEQEVYVMGDIQEMRLSVGQQLQQLQLQRQQISEAITEF